MPRYFTHYWTNRTWTWEHTHGVETNDLLNHTAGNLFMKRGARQGDHVGVTTFFFRKSPLRINTHFMA